MPDTKLYLMTDHHAGTAYIQRLAFDGNGEVADCEELGNLPMPDEFPEDVWRCFNVDRAAIAAAEAARYEVLIHTEGENNDLGAAFELVQLGSTESGSQHPPGQPPCVQSVTMRPSR